jgi:hypothetical protein
MKILMKITLVLITRVKTKTIDMKEEERTYKTIKWILKDHIKKNVKSLWTWKDDNFTCIYENYSGEDRIFTSNQLLNKLNK